MERATLHDKATRGVASSEREQVLLSEWYATQDRDEATELAATQPASIYLAHRSTVQRQIETLRADIDAATSRIQALNAQNETLRQENRALQQQVTEQLATDVR